MSCFENSVQLSLCHRWNSVTTGEQVPSCANPPQRHCLLYDLLFTDSNGPKKTPAVQFLELIFRSNFLSSILAKCVRDEICIGEIPPTSPKGLVMVAQRDYAFCVYR